MHDIVWSESEKRTARRVFDAALRHELGEIIAEFKARATRVTTQEEMWSVGEYLARKQHAVEQTRKWSRRSASRSRGDEYRLWGNMRSQASFVPAPMLQRSLFPDAFEIQEQALAALDELDIQAALRLVEEARERDPGLVNLEPLQAALVWLRRELGSEPVSDELLALLFLTVPEACRSGEITPEAAALIDTVIARQGVARTRTTRAFLDADQRVHRGALLLVQGRFHEAHVLLAASLAEHEERADLWAAFGEASWALERFDEANAALVRALLLSARDVDLFRLRHERLRALQRELGLLHGEPCARELLLVHAWIAGVLTIAPENGWLDRHLPRLHLAATLRPGSPPEQRLRRFNLLFYLDRSRAPGHYDEAQREELQALEPQLFARVLHCIGERERTQTKPLRW